MNTLRPFLQIEQFEDRLLPSTLLLPFDSSRLADSFARPTTPTSQGLQQAGESASLAGFDPTVNRDGNLPASTLDSPVSLIPVSVGGFYDRTSAVWNSARLGAGDDAVLSFAVTQATEWSPSFFRLFAQPQTILTDWNVSEAPAQVQPVSVVVIQIGWQPVFASDTESVTPPTLTALTDSNPDDSNASPGAATDPIPRMGKAAGAELVQSSATNNQAATTSTSSNTSAAQSVIVPGLLLGAAQSQPLGAAPVSAEQQNLGGSRFSPESIVPQGSLAGLPGNFSTLAFTVIGSGFGAAPNNSFLSIRSDSTLTASRTSATQFWREASTDDSELLAPIEVQSPAAVAAAGQAALNEAALNGQALRVLDAIASIGEQLTETPEAYSWLGAAGVLAAAAGYAVYASRKPRQTARFPLDRESLSLWEGEDNAAR